MFNFPALLNYHDFFIEGHLKILLYQNIDFSLLSTAMLQYKKQIFNLIRQIINTKQMSMTVKTKKNEPKRKNHVSHSSH